MNGRNEQVLDKGVHLFRSAGVINKTRSYEPQYWTSVPWFIGQNTFFLFIYCWGGRAV